MSHSTSHATSIERAINRDKAARLPLVASWQRSSILHDLSPDNRKPPERLSQSELSSLQDELGKLLYASQNSLDQLYLAVGDVGCSVVLADKNGVAIARRGAVQDDKTFNKWGLWTGAIWSEKSEGTNGVGTCIIEERPLTIHKDQHFHTKNTGLSCTAAPIFDHHGDMLAVIDVSSCRADLTAGFSKLISASVLSTAHMIETNHFRAQFSGARIVLADTAQIKGVKNSASTALFAIDQDDLVIGATRQARQIHGINSKDLLTPQPLSSLLGQKIDAAHQYATAERRVIQQALARAGGNISKAAAEMEISRSTLHRKLRKLDIG